MSGPGKSKTKISLEEYRMKRMMPAKEAQEESNQKARYVFI